MSSGSNHKQTDRRPQTVEESRKPSLYRTILRRLRGPMGSFGSPRRVLIIGILIFLLSQIIASFIVGLLIALTHRGESVSDILNNSPPYQFVFIVLAEGLAAWWVLRIVRKRQLGLAAIGLGRKPQWQDAKWAAIGFISFYIAWIIIATIITALSPNNNLNQHQDVGFDHLRTALDTALAFIGLVILPPLGEEVLVRGYLFSGLRKSLKFLPAALIVSVLFGLAHLQSGKTFLDVWGAVFDTFTLSLVLVYLRDKTGALYAGIAVHMLNNLIAFFIHFHN